MLLVLVFPIGFVNGGRRIVFEIFLDYRLSFGIGSISRKIIVNEFVNLAVYYSGNLAVSKIKYRTGSRMRSWSSTAA